jgi:hypothetical protein
MVWSLRRGSRLSRDVGSALSGGWEWMVPSLGFHRAYLKGKISFLMGS